MKVELIVGTGYTGCTYRKTIYLDEEDLDNKDTQQIENLLQEMAQDYMFEVIDCGYKIIEEN